MNARSQSTPPPFGPVALARLRAALALLCFSLGLLASWELPARNIGVPLTGAFWLAVAILLAGASLALKRWGSIALCLAAIAFGLGWGTVRLRERNPAEISALLDQGPARDVILRLTLLETPRPSANPYDAQSLTALASCRAAVADAGDTQAVGKVWLRFPAKGQRSPRAGDRLIAKGTFRPIDPPRNPGEFDRQRWARDRGIEGSFRVSDGSMIRPDESRPPLFERADQAWLRLRAALRSRASAVLDRTSRDAGDDSRQILRALLLGEDPANPSDGLRAFYHLGLAHILSISGFHLAVFAGAVLLVLRLFGDLGRLEPLLVSGAIVLFLIIVPPSSPLVRAAAILLALLLAETWGRRYDRLTLLCWVALAVLIVRPSELWALGFQLSFGLAGALLGLNSRFQERLFPPPLGSRALERGPARRLRDIFRVMLATGLLCWGISAPWIAWSVGIFNPLAVLTGILVTPVLVLVLWIGYAALLAGMLVPGLAGACASILTRLTDFSVSTVLFFDSLPGATIRIPWLSASWAIAATVLLALWYRSVRLRRPAFIEFACLLAAWATFEFTFGRALPAEVVTRVHRLDMGTASCAMIRDHSAAVMIDAGTRSPASQGRELPSIARALGVIRLDALVLTSAATESLSGAPEVIRSLAPARLVLIADAAEDPAMEPVLGLAAEHRIPVERAESARAYLATRGMTLPPESLAPAGSGEQAGMLTTDLLSDGMIRRTVWKRPRRPAANRAAKMPGKPLKRSLTRPCKLADIAIWEHP